ncbi:probable ADP-ribosylation factor GTPase-activating protein AGD14 [Arachis stenosperma]|uniref:probable ADP-ribosylation factor GTPase-activating protein AGD14 n=1 Tax=Arachis stenosperma TaxID=217475 RepID=UPI0025AD0BBD|nr:probable ADP-ribosylation factor GTPase-activating protein AGD14 [Arachis stenosperma]XP_057733590.1 probable ADP-ribosylation factor GTPase-activating protein AGD14 [Arachis stenosperma]
MASRLKEDEKNERVIRGLLKLEPNRRCINCNSLGPQYVCTNFWTFVCTNCSGIHREFTHRVKSISMAKFTSQEVNALQGGGNQRAKEIYFKEWDAQRNSFPDSSNVDRLRDFIKHVYVDRRFTGERANDKPPRGKGDNDIYENRRNDMYQGGSRSPPYEDTYERRYSDRSSSGGRSPGYDQESRQYGDYGRSPGRPPIVNDWRREDRRVSDGDYKVENQSPDRARDVGSSSPPVVRPVREILGENVVPLRINEPPKPNSGKAADGSVLTQRTASSSSLASSNGNPVDVKPEITKSLIDFDADPEPPVAPAIPPAQQTNVSQPVVQPEKSSADNWASFDVASRATANSTPSPVNVNPLESVLSQLSVPASLPAHLSGVQAGPTVATAIPAGNATTPASVGGFSAFPLSGSSGPSPGLATALPPSNAGQWTGLQHQQPLFQANATHSTQQYKPPVGGAVNNQPWNISSVPTVQGHQNTPMPHAYHDAINPANTISVVSQPSTEVKSIGRKELPEDLFTVKYPSYPAPVPGWQMGLPHGMGLPRGMGVSVQYNNVVPMPSFPQQSKSVNPFDAGGESPQVQAPTFPSMSSLHGALPSMPPSGAIHPASLGNPSHAWNLPPSSSYVSVLPGQAQTHPSATGARNYIVQQMPPPNLPMPRPEASSFGTGGAVFGLSNPDQQLTNSFSTTPASTPFPAGGNPFG